jgi:DNA-binding transcriptional LysR family regulator
MDFARAVMETESIAALKAFVRRDLGITLLPEFVVADDIRAGILRVRQVAAPNFGMGKVRFKCRFCHPAKSDAVFSIQQERD